MMTKINFFTNVKVQYSHTDKMGYVHHSQYLVYYEFARWEFLRNLGISYRDIEARGVMMPVISAKSEFIKPVYYDDLLKISTTLTINEARIIFRYKILNEKNELVNIGETIVVCIDNKVRKPIKPLKEIINIFYRIDSISKGD